MGDNKQKIRIRLESYDSGAIDTAAEEIVNTAKKSGAQVAGPIPLPTDIDKTSVNRSTHVNKKSSETFERRVCKRLIDIIDPTAITIEDLKKLNVPAGVFIQVC